MPRKTFTFDGKRYDLTAPTTEELAVKVAMKKHDLEEGNIISSGNTKVCVWANEWLTTYKENSVSESWYRTISNIANNIILPALGSTRVKDIKSVHLQKILNEKAGLSSSYQKKIRNIMNEMFDAAVRNRMILSNPADGLVLPHSATPTLRRSLTDRERDFLLYVAQTHRGGLFVKIMLYCGLRPGEVAALQWRNVDFDKKLIKVDSALKKNGTIGEPKSKAGYRSVPIPALLLSELASCKRKPFDFVCTQKNGNIHTGTTIKLMWKNIKREMDILMGAKLFRNKIIVSMLADDLYLYNLRHTYCTDLQSAGVPINVAKELMGHSDISTTSKIYTHSSEIALINAAKMIDDFQSSHTNSQT